MQEREEINILFIDDHHMILEDYKNVLSRSELNNIYLSIDTADNCDTAWENIVNGTYQTVF
ncbi:hypothetical protein RM553_02180 [Zunongwangia sp. F363]|uniref:Response regulatory domain-containing protein n=1 Tax=Autumnicola tepida TaxID=3075595 RepID=A0ABU3C5L6_9FLAO|nr:hypothetical protein [Zunongwangia sp. F363]MDT0641629.1 hypothetical protein [Zunongwangia sp. F363]